MIHLKLFEEYSENDIKGEILNLLRPLINDIIDSSLEELDEINNTGKSIVFNIDTDNECIINARFYSVDTFTDEDIYWADEDNEYLLDILESIKNKCKLIVSIALVYEDEDGDLESLPYDFKRLEDTYPDIEFTSIAAWDLQ